MRRRHEISLDPLMNIAVCLVGALIFVIIATGAGTATTNVVIPTPIENHGTKRTIYIECRDGQLFLIQVEELLSLVSRSVANARTKAGGDPVLLQTALRNGPVANDTYEVDVAHYSGTGGTALSIAPLAGVKGYPMPDYTRERADGWYATLLSRMKPAGECIFFLVRDDSFRVFKNARILAWQQGAEVSFELLSKTDRVTFPVAVGN